MRGILDNITKISIIFNEPGHEFGGYMAKQEDQYEKYRKEEELKHQQINDQEDLALFARIQATCYKAKGQEIRDLLAAVRDMALKKGMTAAEARKEAEKMINELLAAEVFLPNLDVKD